MFVLEYKDIGWWYWLITAWLLSIGISGYPEYFLLAIGLTIFQLAHYIIRERSLASFPIQVRFWYLVLLIISLPEQVQPLYWIPIIGTWVQIFFGYCTMARCLSLLPWNRTERFSLGLVTTTFLTRPVRGSIQGVATAE